MMSCKLLQPKCCVPTAMKGIIRHSSTMSYVQRIKLLQTLKEDDSKCAEVLGQGRFLPFVGRKPLIEMPGIGQTGQTLKWISFPELQRLCPGEDMAARSILLHVTETGQPCFTADAPGGAAVGGPAQHAFGGKFVDPRMALFLLPWEQACTMSHAFAMLHWRDVTNFCPGCGVELRSRTAGHAKRCPSCETVQYPVTSPVGITMVTDRAQTRALLVRQGRHPPGMYSCVAGFLEPGETIESCIRREVAEEVGLDLQEIRYAASQHWPFNGSQLMVGCYGHTDQTELDIDTDELEDARWFSAEEILEAYHRIQKDPMVRLRKNNEGGLWVPPRGTIANKMIKAWLTDRGLLS